MCCRRDDADDIKLGITPIVAAVADFLDFRAVSCLGCVMLEEMANGPGGDSGGRFFMSLVRRSLTHEVTSTHDFDYPGGADLADG